MSMQFSSPRFLLIDDNPAHRALIRRILRKAGYDYPVIEADSIAAGFTALHCQRTEEQFSLVIIDFQLTDGDGRELVSAIRSDEALRATPTLMISTSPLERSRCLAAGADAFIEKSDDFDALTASFRYELNRLLGRAAA
jgi:CheY-like chemotaxis protein